MWNKDHLPHHLHLFLSDGLLALGVVRAGAGEWHHLYLMWLWDCAGAASFIKGLHWPSHHGKKTIPLYLSNTVLRASRQGKEQKSTTTLWPIEASHIHTVFLYIIFWCVEEQRGIHPSQHATNTSQGKRFQREPSAGEEQSSLWKTAVTSILRNCVQCHDSVLTATATADCWPSFLYRRVEHVILK